MTASLTKYEMQLVQNREVLLTKNKIIQNVYFLFAALAEQYKKVLQDSPQVYSAINAKISRGENYQGLPYVMLDFPREFSKDNVFAIRTFFWWGNFFSITLQLSGKYYQQFYPVIQKSIDKSVFKDWYIGTSHDQWQHHFENDNYKLIQDENQNLAEFPFLKLAKKIPLNKWDDANLFFMNNFKLLIEIVESQAPIR